MLRALAGILPLFLVACSSSGGDGARGGSDASTPDVSVTDAPVGDAGPDVDVNVDAGGPVITSVAVTQGPNSVLTAVLTFTTDRPSVGSAHLANTGATAADNALDVPAELAPTTSHSLDLLGMRALSSFDVTVTATDPQGRASAVKAAWTTPALPSWIPAITPVLNNKAQTSPGYTMLSLLEFSGNPVASATGVGSGWIAVDSDFQVVWYYPGGGLDGEKLPNGDLVFPGLGGGWGEIDMMGNTIHAVKNKTLGVDYMTHAFQPEANGNDLGISTTLKYVPGYPAADGGTETFAVVGNKLVEVPPDGGAAVLADTFDFFDPLREGDANPLRVPLLEQGVYRDAGATKDWMHGNAIVPDPSDDTIVASTRTQSWIYKFTRQGKLVWKLGYQGDFTLTNPDTTVPNAAWEYSQHGVYITPSGTIMAFDDGEDRPTAPGCQTADAGRNPCFYSRAVEFSLDTASHQATIAWEYGSQTFGDPDNTSTPNIFGSSYVLPGGSAGPTVLVDDGCELLEPRRGDARPPEPQVGARRRGDPRDAPRARGRVRHRHPARRLPARPHLLGVRRLPRLPPALALRRVGRVGRQRRRVALYPSTP